MSDIRESSGNVFADLGLKNPKRLLGKARIVAQMVRVMETRKLTQKRAAAWIGIERSKLSAILRGRFDDYSTDALAGMRHQLSGDSKPAAHFLSEQVRGLKRVETRVPWYSKDGKCTFYQLSDEATVADCHGPDLTIYKSFLDGRPIGFQIQGPTAHDRRFVKHMISALRLNHKHHKTLGSCSVWPAAD